ncbi:MAG: M48 family metallopeptidase [Candidatus Poribacteria bacterium]|nr:M48 family metallopeptidase [Candidatus Poribacteria bacterium]
MGQISIILIAGLLFLFSFEPPQTSMNISDMQVVLWTIVLTGFPILITCFVTSYVARTFPAHEEENLPTLYRLRRFMIVFECISLAAYLCNLYLLNLPMLIDKYFAFFPMAHLRQTLALLPLLIGLICIRLAFYQVNKLQPGHYREILSLQFKFLLFPLLPMFLYLVMMDAIHWLPYSAKVFIVEHPYILIGLILPVIISAYIFAPLLMQFLWKTEPLAVDSVLKERLDRLTRQSGIKYREVVVWQTGSLLIANAAVAGTLPWNRRIFLTDALLEYFTDEEIETVVAHELGHIRYRHIPTYMLFSLFYLLNYPFFYVLVEEPLLTYLGESQSLLSVVSTLCSLAFLIIYFIVIFRYLSRRCEHQADLYAVRLTGKPEAFKDALVKLAVLNSVPKSIQRFFEIFNTHPSIYRRVEFINQWIEHNSAVQRYKNYLVEVKVLILLLPVLGILAVLLLR